MEAPPGACPQNHTSLISQKPRARRALRLTAAYLYVLVAIVGEDPIEQNEQEGVFFCEQATKPGRQEDGIRVTWSWSSMRMATMTHRAPSRRCPHKRRHTSTQGQGI